MTTDAGSGFDNQAAGRDAGDERLEEESRHLIGEDAGDDALEEETRARSAARTPVDGAFGEDARVASSPGAPSPTAFESACARWGAWGPGGSAGRGG